MHKFTATLVTACLLAVTAGAMAEDGMMKKDDTMMMKKDDMAGDAMMK